MKFHFLSSNNPEAKNTEKKLTELFGQNSVEDADYIIPIGGDGLLLKSLHNFNKLNKPFFVVCSAGLCKQVRLWDYTSLRLSGS